MALKCIKFTNGTKIPVFAKGSSYDDSLPFDSEVRFYTLNNAFLTAGGTPDGTIINPSIDGTTLTDMDGNVWSFSLTEYNQVTLTVTRSGGTTYTQRLNGRYASNSFWYYYLEAELKANNAYDIYLHAKRSTLTSTRSTTGSIRYLKVGYIDGVNGAHGYADDVSVVNPETGYVNTFLRDCISGGTFVNIHGLYLGWPSDPEQKQAVGIYTEPSDAGTDYSTVIVTLTNSVEDLAPEPEPEDGDPYDKDGTSDEGGGEGDFDGDSDSIDIPPLPDLSAVDTGFISLFNPSVSQLQALANYMWSSGFDLDTFKKLFADPMSCILGLSIVPVNVPSGGSSAVTVGNISTGVSMPKASRQYVEVDCGTLNVNEYWGAYLDYSPYTKAEIYLPYIGTHPIATDDIMDKAVHVVYHVDILSGACIAYVKCGDSVLYSFIGQCASSIPITGNDWTNVINGVLSVAGAIGSMVATGGASAPYAASLIASTAVNSMKPEVEKSGSLSGTGGIMGIQKPYLILTRPRQALPARQNKFIGYPSFITVNISDLTGYTEIESVHLEGIPATDAELSEIESILKSGVIF